MVHQQYLYLKMFLKKKYLYLQVLWKEVTVITDVMNKIIYVQY